MRFPDLNPIERMIQTARAAARCREAARNMRQGDDAAALMRVADRYSALVSDISQEIMTGEGR